MTATTRFGTEVAYDERFVEYAGGMAVAFVERLDRLDELDLSEILWLHKLTGGGSLREMCQQLIDQMLIQRTTKRLKS